MPFYEKGKVYVGKPCKKCGGKVRYANSRRCVQCKNALSKAEWERKKGAGCEPDEASIEQVLERHSLES